MKKISTLIVCSLLLTRCYNDHSRLADFEKRKADSLKTIDEENKKSINSLVGMLNEIEGNLDSIAGRQHSIVLYTKNAGDIKNFSAEINRDIEAINQTIILSQKRINHINNTLKNSRKENSDLKSAMQKLNEKLALKENELSEMREKLSKYGGNLENLNDLLGELNLENAVLEETVAEETEMLHSVYYVVGSSRELEKDSVIDRKGGLLGLGMVTKMKNNYNNKAFTRINNIETTVIPVNSRAINIVTSHASGTYIFDKEKGEIKNIIITDPEKFWEASKYLVVVKN